jgi:hypothetical protein
MYFMNVRTLVLAQEGDTDCIQQVFNYCQGFISRPNSIVKSYRFKSTIRFHPDLTLDDVRQDLLISSVNKVIKFFNPKLLGNDVEAFIGQAIKFCANDWLIRKNYRTFSPHSVVEDEVKVTKNHSLTEIMDRLDRGEDSKFSDYFKESSWNPEQESIYNDLCNTISDMVEDHVSILDSKSSFGTGLSSKVSSREYIEIYRLILFGLKKADIARKLELQVQLVNRFHYNVLNPLILLAMDDDAIYQQYLPKLNRSALKLIKNKKGIDFLRSYGL